jgi:tetratricopeptide (TPR) repeat protein
MLARMRTLLLAASTAVLLAGATTRARAQTDLDVQARAHFSAAQAYFDTGDYEGAIREFTQAHQLSQRPELLYNLYLCHERLGHLAEAIDHLARYLESVTNAPNRAVLEARLGNLRRRAESGQTGTGVADAGTGSDAGAAIGAGADGGSGDPEPGPPGEVDEPSGGNPGFVVGLALAAAGVVTTAIFGGLAAAEDGDLAGTCGRDAGRTCSDDEVSSLRTFTLIADVGLVAAGVGAVVATIFLLTAPDPGGVAVVPAIGPGVAGASAAVRF